MKNIINNNINVNAGRACTDSTDKVELCLNACMLRSTVNKGAKFLCEYRGIAINTDSFIKYLTISTRKTMPNNPTPTHTLRALSLLLTIAAQASSGVKILCRPLPDSILLRWAPTDKEAWDLGLGQPLQLGFIYETQ
jgi:hypothetical protein